MLKNFKYFLYYLEYQAFIDNNIKLLPKLLYCKENDDLLFDNLVFSKLYFRTIALEDGIISFNIWQTMDTDKLLEISYSTDDGQTWTTFENEDNKSNNYVISVYVSAGDKILWKGKGAQTGFYDGTDYYGSFFSSTCYMNVDGNVMSLICDDEFTEEETELEYNGQFAYLFCDKNGYDSTYIMHAGNLYLPYTIQGKNYFNSIFKNTNPITKPILLHTNFEGITYTKELPKQFEKWLSTLEVDNDKIFLPSTVRIIMGNLEITDSCYNFEKNVIIIDNVTDDIEITASAVTVDSTLTDSYEILTYIGVIKKDNSPGIKFTSILVTQNTKFSTSLRMWGNGRRMISQPSGDITTSYFLGVGDVSGVGKFCWNKKVSNASHKFATYVQKRFDVICDKGNFNVQCKTLNLSQTNNMHVDGETFTGSYLTLMGNTTSVSDGAMFGDIYELTHWSDDVLINRYVPARRKSDNKVGMLDIYGNAGFALKNNYSWLAPYIKITNTYTNCSITQLSSSDSGIETYMTIGKQWQFKYTPSADYTFRNSVFEITIDGIDKTNDYATYDAETDTWTITYIPHWNNNVIITATPVSYTLYYSLKDTELANTTEPELGDSYTSAITPVSGKQLLPHTVKVYMSKVDITDTVYNYETNTIIIPEVTGGIDIYGESAVVDSTYKPIYVVRTKSRSTAANSNGFYIPYYPNNNTKLVADININQNSGYTVLYAIRNPNTEPTSTSPQFNFWIRVTALTNYKIMFGSGSTGTATNTDGLFKFGVRNLYTCDKGVITYTNNAGNIYKRTLNGGVWSYTEGYIRFFSEGITATSTYPCNGEIFRITISEDDNLLFDYIPVKRISDGGLLLYNLVNSEVISLSSNFIGEYNKIISSITNCTLTFLSSADSGNKVYAVINKNWSCSFTSTTGYVWFKFQVMINGVDETNNVAVYDSITNTYTVTLVSHWNDSIIITAKAVEPYDSEVEYLESDGIAYIDTNLKAANTVTFDISMYIDPNNDDSQLIGGRNGYNNKAINIYFDKPNETISWGYGNATATLSTTISAGDYLLNNTEASNVLKINDASITGTASTFTSDYNIFLFALNTGGSMVQPGENAILRIKSAKFYSSGKLVRDFIPVRKNGVGYLLDIVSGNLYGNTNISGAFTYGPDSTIKFEEFYKSLSKNLLTLKVAYNGEKVDDLSAKITLIQGNTFIFNLHFENVGDEVTPIVGATYLLLINGVRSVVTATADTSNFVSTTSTDMCINLTHMYGPNPRNFPLTQALFEEFFPNSYYSYESGKLINMAITTFNSSGTHLDGTTFNSSININVSSLTGKLDGTGESEVIFPYGMGCAYNTPVADIIWKDTDGIWKGRRGVRHMMNFDLATSSTYTGSGTYVYLYHIGNATTKTNAVYTSGTNLLICDKYLTSNWTAMTEGNTTDDFIGLMGNAANTFLCVSKSKPRSELPIVNIVYPLAGGSRTIYILDDQLIMETLFETNQSAVEKVYPENGLSPVTAPMTLNINYPVHDYEVERLCVQNWGTSIPGRITKEEAAAVTTLGSVFTGNTNITSFNELEYFTGLTTLRTAFQNCTGLTSVKISKSPLTNMYYAFNGCSSLTSITIPNDQNWTFVQEGLNHTFSGCTAFTGQIDLSSVKQYTNSYVNCTAVIHSSNTTSIIMPRTTLFIDSAFVDCRNLVSIDSDGMCLCTTGSVRLRNIIGANGSSHAAISLTTITSGIPNANISLDLGYAPLTHESAVAVINNLATVSTTLTLTFSSATYATLSSEEIAVATGKGWTIATKG